MFTGECSIIQHFLWYTNQITFLRNTHIFHFTFTNHSVFFPITKEEITSMDTVWLYTTAMLFPYYLISQFSFHFVDVHFYIMWIIISHCVMLTVREALQIKRVPIRYVIAKLST